MQCTCYIRDDEACSKIPRIEITTTIWHFISSLYVFKNRAYFSFDCIKIVWTDKPLIPNNNPTNRNNAPIKNTKLKGPSIDSHSVDTHRIVANWKIGTEIIVNFFITCCYRAKFKIAVPFSREISNFVSEYSAALFTVPALQHWIKLSNSSKPFVYFRNSFRLIKLCANDLWINKTNLHTLM